MTTTIDEEPSDPAADKLYDWMRTRTTLKTLNVSLSGCRLTELDSVYGLANGALVDVLGVIDHVGNLVTMTSRDGKHCSRRVLRLVDEKGGAIPCTVWNQHAEADCVSWVGHTLVVKDARVKDGNGRSVNVVPTSYLVLDPPMEAADRIDLWYRNRGESQAADLPSADDTGETEETKTESSP